MKLMVYGFVVGMLVFEGCATSPGPSSSGSPTGVIDCATDAVRRNWPTAYPEVMVCLTGAVTNPMACLSGVAEAVKVTVDVVACIVKDAGKEGAMQSQINPADVISKRKAERAEQWLSARGFEFAP